MLLKVSPSVQALCITKVINMSIANGKFPTEIKIAQVIPKYKNKGSTSDYSNYQPLSCTVHIAKVVEIFYTEATKTHLHKHNFITDDESAYRPNHSVETSLHKVTIDVLERVNEGLITAIMLFDLPKCINTFIKFGKVWCKRQRSFMV